MEQYGNTYPMKWFKFVVGIQLFANALFSIFGAVNYITGMQYSSMGVDPSAVYTYWGSRLRAADICMGVINILMAVFAVYIRQQLVKFKRRSDDLYLVFIFLNIMIPVIYGGVIGIIIQQSAYDTQTMASVISLIILLTCNYSYFRKRRDLFCN